MTAYNVLANTKDRADKANAAITNENSTIVRCFNLMAVSQADVPRLIAAVEAGWRAADGIIQELPPTSHEAQVARLIRSAILNALEPTE